MCNDTVTADKIAPMSIEGHMYEIRILRIDTLSVFILDRLYKCHSHLLVSLLSHFYIRRKCRKTEESKHGIIECFKMLFQIFRSYSPLARNASHCCEVTACKQQSRIRFPTGWICFISPWGPELGRMVEKKLNR